MDILTGVTEVLKDRGLKIAAAESCTGGLLGVYLTSMPGSSQFFELGMVTYSNEAKIKLLGVKESTISQYGAVSENTAKEMAANIKNIADVNIGVGITGIAGPDGGSIEKPVGLVYIGVSMENTTHIYKHFFEGNRADVREKSVLAAIEHISVLLKEKCEK